MKNFLGSINSREKSSDSFARLRYTVESVLTSKRSYSSSQMRIEVLTALYEAFWGSYITLFLPGTTNVSHMRSLLSDLQAKHPINETATPGRSCGHIFQKGECCYRCKSAYSIISSLSADMIIQRLCFGRQLCYVFPLLQSHPP